MVEAIMKNIIHLLTLVFMTSTSTLSSAESIIDCNFEDTQICGYTQDNTDNFDWTRFSGPTSSHETGPNSDHTFSSSVGHYMYIEASPPLGEGDTGRLISSTYTPISTAQCLEFWYHMHGSAIGTLNAYFQRRGNHGYSQFTEQGDKGNSWFQARIGIPANSQPFQLVFEGIRGTSYQGDIAIDDVIVKPWNCGVSPAGPDTVNLNPARTNHTITEHYPLNVSCTCGSCTPDCIPQWSRNGATFSNGSSLHLDNVLRDSGGRYACTCTNPATSKSKSTYLELTVMYGPDDVVVTPVTTTFALREGSSLAPITCSCGMCKPSCSAQWTFNGVDLSDNGVLELQYVTRNRTGQYVCICTNPSSLKNETQHFDLTVQYGPDTVVLMSVNTTNTLQEFSSMPTVECNCGDCEPRCSAQWTRNGITLSDNSTLELRSVTRNSTGQYICTCTNPSFSKQERQLFNLTVQYGPDDVVFTPVNSTYMLQELSSVPSVTCDCGVCEPKCTAQWTFDGIDVGTNVNGTLRLMNVTRNTAGHYICTCTNPSSSKQERRHFGLTVQFGPDHVLLAPNNTIYTIDEGYAMSKINCTCGDCEPECVTQWSFQGFNIQKYTGLEMGNVSRTDTGNYTCTCMNPSTLKQKKAEYEVVVEYGPDRAMLTPDNTSYIVQEEYAELDVVCSCGECRPSCSVQWTFDGVNIRNNHSVKVSKVLRNNTGQYTCFCMNPSTLKQEISSFSVVVHYGPNDPILAPNTTNYNKTVGSQLDNITCTCGECEPTCIVKWTLNDVLVSKNDFVYSDRLSTRDIGQYVCTCSNTGSLKKAYRHFNLSVNALPNIKPCPQNTDELETSWSETLAGEMVSKDCQGKNTTGSISRVCSKTGEWLIPRYTCIRSSFTDVEDKLKEIERNPSNSDVSDVLSELVNLTDTKEGDDEMYSGELESVTRVLDIVATLASSDLPPTEEQSRSFINVVSNILSEEKKRSWESLSQTKAKDGASKLLQSVDSLSEAMTNGLEDTNASVITIIQPNIVLEARKVDVSQQEINFPMPSMTPKMETFAGAKLSLPLQHGSASDVRRYTVALYKSLAGVLPNTVATRNDSENDRSQMLNTPVVSLQMFPYRAKLYKPLNLVFEHQQVNLRHPKCSYWSFHGHRWETDGCHVKSSTGSQTTCECYHLTNFAVLMSPWTEPAADSTAIEIISIVGCSISIVCLIATAAVHILLWRNLKNDRAIILINICVALSVTYIIFLSGINQTSDTGACAAVAALLHYILLVVFCLMLAEGIEITITVKYVFLTKSRIKWMIPLAWGIPAAIVGLSMGITRLKGYGTENFCWLSVENGVIWAFVGPAMLIIVVNVVFLAILLRTMLKTKAYLDMSELDRIKCSARCLCVLVPLMGCTWVLGIFYVNDRTAWIQYVFALCNSLQGFFIFLFHGLLNKHLRTAIKSRHKKYKDSHSLSKSHSTRRTEVTCALNPVYSSDVPIESKPNPLQKYGRKLSLQFKKTGSYSPMQE